jgi:hypothetical protein
VPHPLTTAKNPITIIHRSACMLRFLLSFICLTLHCAADAAGGKRQPGNALTGQSAAFHYFRVSSKL